MSATIPQLPPAADTFAQVLTATPRGARLARLLAIEQFQAWRLPPDIAERGETIVAELAANAVLHGAAGDWDFRLVLRLGSPTRTVRIEVADPHSSDLSLPTQLPGIEAESGRGLLIVSALADRWGASPYLSAGKTVWAELDEPSTAATVPRRAGRGRR
ncbi:ATP-binding protein [Yinghuangia soli]|uniref:ATP-binding protein n=1 Tax=Yinghuangia soli TaxID=2908204 RepID=A0AA41TWS1_9ACTN|nr:ATP-binding protein [Yinghuangia soli]MCF2526123.1 ATP-binding protein [Yinghuangia soli]